MLQALIDESDSHEEQPRVFVMGGYLATVEQWKKLTNAWQAELDRYPKIRYFSFREAFPTSGKPRGEFRGMTTAQRDARVAGFRRIIEECVEAELGVGFFVEHYQRAYNWAPAVANNPYGFAAPTLLSIVGRHMEGIGLPKQQVDFILDDRKIDEPKVLEAWSWLKEQSLQPDPPDIFETILVNAPQFRGSRDVIALQAADMFAGSTRAANIAHLNGREPVELPGTTKQLRGLFAVPTEEEIRETAEEARRRGLARAGL
jgi:Protein of unknown function (DUF3800)